MIDHDGYVKYIDFGFACQGTVESKCKAGAGTVEYMTPEVLNAALNGTLETSNLSNLENSKAQDVWALGILIYRLLKNDPHAYPFSRVGHYLDEVQDYAERMNYGRFNLDLNSTIENHRDQYEYILQSMLITDPRYRLTINQIANYVNELHEEEMYNVDAINTPDIYDLDESAEELGYDYDRSPSSVSRPTGYSPSEEIRPSISRPSSILTMNVLGKLEEVYVMFDDTPYTIPVENGQVPEIREVPHYDYTIGNYYTVEVSFENQWYELYYQSEPGVFEIVYRSESDPPFI